MSERIGEAERRERPEGEGLAEGENAADEIVVLRNRKKLLKLQLKAAASALKKQDRVSMLFVAVLVYLSPCRMSQRHVLASVICLPGTFASQSFGQDKVSDG